MQLLMLNIFFQSTNQVSTVLHNWASCRKSAHSGESWDCIWDRLQICWTTLHNRLCSIMTRAVSGFSTTGVRMEGSTLWPGEECMMFCVPLIIMELHRTWNQNWLARAYKYDFTNSHLNFYFQAMIQICKESLNELFYNKFVKFK